jgi:RNA polymerase sigma factor CnrH
VKSGDHQNDEDLLRRAARGEREAFDEIVRRHKGTIYAFVRRYIGDGDDAYDVLQNTFVSAWLAIGKFDLERPLLPWLRTIALNKCRDFGRRATVRRLLLLAKKAEPAETVPGPDEDRGGDARLKRLDRAILTLPPFYREALLLTTISGLSHTEVAEILKTTAKAVEMRVRRARKQIGTQLGEADPEG